MVTWIWFDLDDTLHDFAHASEQATARTLDRLRAETALPYDAMQSAYRRTLDAHNRIMFVDGRESHAYRRERFQAAIGGFTGDDTRREALIFEALAVYEKVLLSSLRLKPGCIEMLDALKNRDLKLAIISDAPHDAQTRVIEALRLRPYFDAVLTSGLYKVEKAKGLIQTALSQLDVTPAEAIMIGDSIARDVRPAREAGLIPIWFNEHNKIATDDVLTICRLDALPSLLAGDLLPR